MYKADGVPVIISLRAFIRNVHSVTAIMGKFSILSFRRKSYQRSQIYQTRMYP